MVRAHLHVLLLAAWVATAPWALTDPPPPLPPGVSYEPTVGSPIGGYSYAVEYLSVDWTHPLLKVGHEVGPIDRTNPPPTWGRAEREAPGVLRIQLIEPLRGEDGWDLGFPFWEAAADERSPVWGVSGNPPGESSHVSIGGACPWLVGGPPMRKMPEWVSPLGRDAARAGVRWLGRASDLGGVAKLRLGERCLMSWTSPREGRTRFGLMVNQADASLATPPVVKWLQRET